MELLYASFCLADSVFYDSPSRIAPSSTDLAGSFMTGRRTPDGWVLEQTDPWTYLTPIGVGMPAQGWKVHVTATTGSAAPVLDAVWRYCVPRRIAFKFVPDRVTLLLRNGKYADRGGSGKFITIYPSAAELEPLLTELGAELDGQPGPYILSDLRWGSGPLHVRYGGFTRRSFRAADGQLVQAIADPDGRLVPDLRSPTFELPPWAEIPNFLAPQVAARLAGDEAPEDFPYRIERPLHFSNGGGVYVAIDTRTERRVVLREARPYAGLDGSGRDAVQRLEREHEILKKLAGTGVVPELYDRFVCWEHHFLAEEYIEGQTLGSAFVRRYPLIHPDATEPDIAEYTQWALEVMERVRSVLGTMHDHGIVFGDLHPYNVIVRADGEVRFVDLEVASYLTEEQRSGLGVPGYVPPDGRTGSAADRYALACMYVSAFLPLAPLFPLDPTKAEDVVGTIRRRFPLPGGLAAEILTELQPAAPSRSRSRAATLAHALDAGDADWPAIHDSMRRGIVASATPEREDRVFPGDVRQFIHNGLGFAYGAAGVLHVLAGTGAGRYPDYEQWLVHAVQQGAHKDAVGFFDGLHGIAYTLEGLGRRDDALAVLEQASNTSLDHVSAAFFDGLAGIGLNLLHFAERTGERTLRAQAFTVADRLVEFVSHPADEGPDGVAAQQPRAGLLYGASGHALFFIRLFEATGDRQFLDHATTALRRDLDRTVEVDDGTRQMDEGWRVMPYLATGSAGLAFVLNEYLAHQDDEEYANALVGIRRAATPEFIVGSGLFNGRAGLIALLARLRDTGRHGDTDQSVIERHLRRLAWHVIDYRNNVAFPGDQLLRLSMDVATGTAGVLLATAAALDGDHTLFPFLAPAADRRGGEPR